MTSPSRRRGSGYHRQTAGPTHGRRRRLFFETLEARLFLSASALEAYEVVSASWMGTAAAAASSRGDLQLQAAADQSSEWIVRLTPAGAQAAVGVAGAADVLGDLGFAYDVVAGLGLPGQLLVRTFNAADAIVRQAFDNHASIAYAGHNAAIQGGNVVHPDENDYAQGRLFGLNISAASGVGNFPTVDSDIDAPEAWFLTTGDSSVVVAVLDSGIDYNHQDLAGNIAPGGRGYDFYGYHAGGGDADPMDEQGHGTHVAGIIGAEGNNGVGVVGVNWDVSLLPIRILGPNNSGDIADAITGINYVTGLATGVNIITGQNIPPVNVRVINASWSVAGQFVEQASRAALVDAIQAAGAADILFVAAAGNGDILNNALDLNSATSLPATIERDQAVTLDNLIVVAASDPYDGLTAFSNYGAGVVDLAAPGDDILSTLPGNDYGYRDGTSMAAPFVSGVAALVLANPANQGLTAAEVKEAILESVDLLATPDERAKVTTGGRLNAFNAVSYAAFAPRVAVQSAPDVVTAGAPTHNITLRYTGKTAINVATLGVDDIVVRRGAAGAPVTVQGVSFVQVGGDPKVVDVTYTLAGPGDGVWSAVDNGDYQIEVVAGSVSDTTQSTDGTIFAGADGFSVNITAGVFHVGRTFDAVDALPGNGVPDVMGPGSGFTLRGALQEANLVPGGVVILAPGTYTLSISGAGEDGGLTGDLDISGSVSIASDGTGEVIINAAGFDRVFDVLPGGSLTLDGVTITGGNAGDQAGGGVRNNGTTIITNATIEDSAAQNGGGIYNAGTLNVSASVIAGNFAAADGGGVYNAGQATITESTVEQNTAQGFQFQVLEKVGSPFIVNTTTAGYQYSANVAVGEQGNVVVSWVTQYGNFDEQVFAQRLSPTGAFVGGEIHLNDPRPIWRVSPSAAVRPDGKFAIGWQDRDVAMPTANLSDALLAIFDENGNRLTTVQMPANAVGNQLEVDVLVNSNGDYLTAYGDNSGALEDGNGVYIRRFAPDGTPLSAPMRIPQNAAVHQKLVDVALFDNDEGIAVWQHSLDGVNWDIYGRFLNSAGEPTGDQFLINVVTAGAQTDASVTASEDGFIVTWSDAGRGIIARTFHRSGLSATPTSGEIVVAANAEASFSESAPLPDGAFAITWTRPQSPGSGPYDVWVRAYDNLGAPIGDAHNLVLPNWAQFQTRPSIAAAPDGTVWVAWEGRHPSFDVNGIYAQRLSFHSEFSGGRGGGVYNVSDGAPVANSLTLTASTISNNVASVDGGGVYNAGTMTATNATVSGNDAGNQGGGLYNAAAGTATLTHITVTDNSATGQSAVSNLVPVSGEFRVNSITSGVQDGARVAMNASGRVFVAWSSSDLGAKRVEGQIYNADGTLTSGELNLSGASSDERLNPYLALMDNGHALVAWSGTGIDGEDLGVAGSTFLPNGDPDAAINPSSFSADDQIVQAVATDGDSRYVVIWQDDKREGSSPGIFARIYDQDGNPVGADFQVNSTTPEEQLYADVGMWDDGSFVVAYQSSDGGDENVRARLFSAAGTPLLSSNGGNDFVLSGSASGKQRFATLAVSDEGFVAVWVSNDAVVARRFDRNGAALGADIPVTGSAVSPAAWARVTMLPDGGFLVVWDVNYPAGDAQEVWGRRFNAVGTPVGAAFRINSTTTGYQYDPSVASDEDGSVFIVWTGSGPGDAPDGIFARRYQLIYSDAPGIANVGGTINLKNSIVAQNSSAHDAPDIAGQFASGGGNLVGNGDGAAGLTQPTDQVGTTIAPLDARLGPLANNGGKTKTHLPEGDSPAVDAAVAAGAPAQDQRSVARPKDGDNNGTPVPDIGAVELFHAAVSGKKFHDRDGDGLQDPGEEGLAGWTIFVDLDLDGRLDENEPFAVTDSEGNYTIEHLIPGDYTIAEVAQPGWQRTHVDTSFVQAVQDDLQGGTVDSLDGARAMAVTANGRFVFVAAADEAAIARFERNLDTGELTYLGATTSARTVTPGGTNILFGVEQIVIGAVGGVTQLYALSPHGALSVFDVNVNTGALTFVDDVLESTLSTVPNPKQFNGSTGLAISPDGTRIYVSNNSPSAVSGGAIFVFERSGTRVALRRRLTNGAAVSGAGGRAVAVRPDGNYIFVAGVESDGTGTLAVFKHDKHPEWINYRSIVRDGQPDSLGTLVHGLAEPSGVAVSADGRFVYVTAAADGAVSVFEFHPTSETLTLIQTLTDGEVDYLGNAVSGIQQASAITMSSDGERVYVAGKVINEVDPENPIIVGAVVVFRRDAATGRLSFLHELIDGASDGFGAPIEYIDATTALLAPDDRFVYVASGDYEDAVTVLRRDSQGSDAVSLAVGEILAGVDFANRAQPGAILGLVYENLDGNQQPDVNEPALSGWQVYLDLNNNGIYDAGGANPEPLVVTDSTGVYAFEDLAAQTTYHVRLVPRSGWSVFAPASGVHHLTVNPGEVVLRNDFGVRLVSPVGAGTGSLQGIIFHDADEDGVRDPIGEPGIPGVRVFMDLDKDGVRDINEPSTLTSSALGSEGQYTFANVPDTPFEIRIDPTDGALATRRIVAPVGNALTEQTYSLGASTNPAQVAAADFDLDGDLDLAVLTLDGVVSLFRNSGNGQYVAVAPLAASLQATSMAVGDFNGDSKPDIALTSSTINRVAIALNTTASPAAAITFNPYVNLTTTLTNWDVVAADFTGDNKADLALAQRAMFASSQSQVLILRSTTISLVPSFAVEQIIPVGRQPRAIEAAQVDGVVGLDLVIANQLDRTVQILRKSGGVFVPEVPITVPTSSVVDAPFSISLGHFNADSKIDILVGNSHSPILSLLLSENNSSYGPAGYTLYNTKPLDAKGIPRDVVAVDIDNDGDRDIVVGAVAPAAVTVLRNTGTAAAPQFSEPEVKGVGNLQTDDLPGVKSLVVGDLSNNGGLPDIAAVTGKIDAGALVFFGNATVDGFYRVAAPGGSTVGNLNFALATTGAAGDFDHDNDIDGFDFLAWQRGFGSIYTGAHYQAWKNSFGASSSVLAQTAATTAAVTTADATSSVATPTNQAAFGQNGLPWILADSLLATAGQSRYADAHLYRERELYLTAAIPAPEPADDEWLTASLAFDDQRLEPAVPSEVDADLEPELDSIDAAFAELAETHAA